MTGAIDGPISTFALTGMNLYVRVGALSTNDNTKHLQQLKTD